MPGSSSGQRCFQALGSPRPCYRVPCCETLKRETPVAPHSNLSAALFWEIWAAGASHAGGSRTSSSGHSAAAVPAGDDGCGIFVFCLFQLGPGGNLNRRDHPERPQSKRQLQPGNGAGRRGGAGSWPPHQRRRPAPQGLIHSNIFDNTDSIRQFVHLLYSYRWRTGEAVLTSLERASRLPPP